MKRSRHGLAPVLVTRSPRNSKRGFGPADDNPWEDAEVSYTTLAMDLLIDTCDPETLLLAKEKMLQLQELRALLREVGEGTQWNEENEGDRSANDNGSAWGPTSKSSSRSRSRSSWKSKP